MGSVFSSKAVYQIIAVLECLFSLVLLCFAVNTLFIFYHQNKDFREEKFRIQYSAFAAVAHSVLQIGASLLLVLKSRPGVDDKGKEKDPGVIPRIWILYGILQIGILLFIFLFPVNYCVQSQDDYNQYQVKKDDKIIDTRGKRVDTPPCYAYGTSTEMLDLRKSLKEMYTYTITNLLFKVLFLWMISTTVTWIKRRPKDRPMKAALVDHVDVDSPAVH